MERVCPLVLFVCVVHSGLSQPAKRDAPPATEFALEFLSRSEGYPSYLQLPPLNGSMGMGTGPGSSGGESSRKGVRLSLKQDTPGILRIHFSISDEIGPDGETGPDDSFWRDAGDYTLRVIENETLTVPELEEYGFFQFRIVPAKSPMANPLRVTNAFKSLEVVGVEEVIPNHYRVLVRNVSERPVYALYGRFSADSLTGNGPGGSNPLIQPRETKEFIYSPPSRGGTIGGRKVRVTDPQPELRYVAVYYADGECEGESLVCAQITAGWEANRVAASMEVAVLEKALDDPEPEKLLREYWSDHKPVDPETVRRIVEQTLARFPDTPPSLAAGLTNRVKSTFSEYDRRYGSVLDALSYKDPKAPVTDIKKLIRDRIKERQAFAALP